MLTEAQELVILQAFEKNPRISLNDLVNLAFPEKPELDGRSKEGRLIRSFLTQKNIHAKTSNQYDKKQQIELNNEQKEFISNNCAVMKAVEMARVLFDNQKLSNLNHETKAVQAFVKTIPSSVKSAEPVESGDEDESLDYKPPNTIDRAVARINKYILNGYDRNNLKPSEKKSVDALINYLHTHRFIYQISTYSEDRDRQLFESSFIRYSYDKPDLTQEEVDQYIVLCTDIIIAGSIQRRIELLQDLLDNSATDTEGKRISMSLVQSISTAQTEYNQCIGRQQKMLSDLKVKRSQRISDQIKETASILNLVTLWKSEESRKDMLRLAELRKISLKKEIERLSSLEEIKCKILGISEEEILNG